MVTLHEYLTLAAILFCIGLGGVLSRKNAIVVLIGIEMMLNAANINLVAFSYFVYPQAVTGQIFVIFSIAVAGAEVAIGLALILAIYRHFKTIHLEEINTLKG